MLIVTVVLPAPGSVAGLKLQLLFEGKLEQAKVTVPLKPDPPVIVRVDVALCPALTVPELELEPSVKSGATVTFTAFEVDPMKLEFPL